LAFASGSGANVHSFAFLVSFRSLAKMKKEMSFQY